MSLPNSADQKKILKLLADVEPTIDDLLLSGLAAASESTQKVLVQSFQNASQMRLLRLGSTLRVAAEEVGRFASNDLLFSRRRYSFFINRAWMLIRGMRQAIDRADESHWKTLTWQPGGGTPIESMKIVTLGVSKRVVPGAFCGFEFRLRCVDEPTKGPADSLKPLIWSTIFPMKKDVDVPAEAYLRLPQKQKFKPVEWLERCVIEIHDLRLSEEGRIQLADDSTVEQLEKFDDWERHANWDPQRAVARLDSHPLNPFELDVELQEEVFFQDWHLDKVTENDREHRFDIELICSGERFHVFASQDEDGKAFRKRLTKWSKTDVPIFGVMHYEQGLLALQPLSVFDVDGPKFLTLEEKDIDYRKLMKALNF